MKMDCNKGLVIATVCLVFFILLNTIMGSFRKKEPFVGGEDVDLSLRNETANYLAKSFLNYASGNKSGLYKSCNTDIFPSFSVRGKQSDDWKTEIAGYINKKSYEMINNLVMDANCIIISNGSSLSGATAFVVPIPKHSENPDRTVVFYDSELLNAFFKQNATFSTVVPADYKVIFTFDTNEKITASPVVTDELKPKSNATTCTDIEVYYNNISKAIYKIQPGFSVTPIIPNTVTNNTTIVMSNYIPPGIDINSSIVRYTVSMWIKQDNVQNNWRNIMYYGFHGNWPNDDRTPAMWITPGRRSIHFRVRAKNNFNDGYDIDDSRIPPLGEWYHALFTVNGRNVRGYINGKQIYNINMSGGDAVWGDRKDKHFKVFSEGTTGGISVKNLYMLPYVSPETGTNPGMLSIAALYNGVAAPSKDT